MVNGITFNEQLIASADISHAYWVFSGKESGVTRGCEVTYSGSSLYVAAGYMFSHGRLSKVTGTETIEAPTVATGTLYCRLVYEVDLSKTNTTTSFLQGYFKVLQGASDYPTLTQEDLDGTGTVYQIPFARFLVTVDGISSLVDERELLSYELANKADKATDPTDGNLASLDEDGNLEDSGVSSSILSSIISNSHNSLFRFKDITSYFTGGTLYNRITGTGYDHPFYDIYAGDYFDMGMAVTCPDSYGSTQGSRWVTIAGCNSLYGIGDTGLTRNHLVMVPGKGLEGDQHFGRHRMNSSNTTSGGYQGSEMFSSVLGSVVSSGATSGTINQQLKYIFGDHLITTRELSSNAMTSTLYNRFGSAGGASSGWGWHDAQACLMSEVEVYGATVWSSSGYDTGTGKNQFPLFAHFTQALNNRSAYYWLKDVASASYFCYCTNSGAAGCDGASNADAYVRPRFVIG